MMLVCKLVLLLFRTSKKDSNNDDYENLKDASLQSWFFFSEHQSNIFKKWRV